MWSDGSAAPIWRYIGVRFTIYHPDNQPYIMRIMIFDIYLRACDIYPWEIYPQRWVQYILFAEPLIAAGIGLSLIQTAMYVRAEALCADNVQCT